MMSNKLEQLKEFNNNAVQKTLAESRNEVIHAINELFYMSTDEWDVEQIEKGLHKLNIAVEGYKIADAKSSLMSNIIGFMEV